MPWRWGTRFLAVVCLMVCCRAGFAGVSGCGVFPADNIWNVPVIDLPVDASSGLFVTAIGADEQVHADFGSGEWPPGSGSPIGIPYALVPGSQPPVAVTFDYEDESDAGPYPIPDEVPIEGGANGDGDRHVLVVDQDRCRLYELFDAHPQTDGSWQAGSGAVFDLNANDLRPDGWTSADAAGLPILTGLVRFDEVAGGQINHALRFTAPQTRREYVWPARHFASSLTGDQYPPMGQRFRLKADVDLSGFSGEVRIILQALKTYGMILADNGSAWYISGAPDERWDNDVLRELHAVHGADFEAVDVSSLMIDPESARAAIDSPIIIDHTCTDINLIPDGWLEQAKQLTVHYAHTSHGSQVNTGAENLETLDPLYRFARRESSTEGLPSVEDPPALRMYDGNPPETYITPEDYWSTADGRDRTRAVADTGHYDFSMWSWCGQVSDADPAYIQTYLDVIDAYESEYSSMRFIFMTGHLDGTGPDGNLHQRNEQIRAYCRANNKVLFDFADIERFNPDGEDFLDLGANDNCDTDDGNWAAEWCAAHPASDLCDSCGCAHSQALNCNLKARALWWMMARLAGWPGPEVVADFSAEPRGGKLPLAVRFADESSGNPTDWIWDFGDGSAGRGASPTHTYTSAGTYTVTLTASSVAGGHTKTKTGYIEVNSCDNDPVINDHTGFGYRSIQNAVGIAENGDRILLQALDFWESVRFDRDVAIFVSSGYACEYTDPPPGTARICGRVEVSAGSLNIVQGSVCIAGANSLPAGVRLGVARFAELY